MTLQTTVFSIDPGNYRPEELAEPARILREGGLVAFPTETVYGLGASIENPASIQRLSRMKERPPEKPFTIHIPDPEETGRHVERIPPRARDLMERFWPGPLTIVFPGRAEQGIGVRCPSHPVARDFLRACGVPVVAPSANPSGGTPPCSAPEILRSFAGTIEGIIDAGPVPLGRASTVVRVSDGGMEVLREGFLRREDLESSRSILLVCTGNTCRSPMAEALLRNALARRLGLTPADAVGHVVRSAGAAAVPGAPASMMAVQVMREMGCDISHHTSTPLTESLLEDADIVYVMEPSLRGEIVQWQEASAGKIRPLMPQGIPDPIGGDIASYRRCARDIQESIERIVEEL